MANIRDLGNSIKKNPGVWLLALVFVLGLVYLLYNSHWNGLHFVNVTSSNLLGYLTPLILTAALIERAVEVVISPWRDPDADTKTSAVKAAAVKAKAPNADANAQQTLKTNTDALNEYRGKTRQYAFAIAVALSVLAVTAGIRTLWPLLDQTQAPPADQLNYFRWYDMVLTALLLAGGANGLHAPINAFTSFFEKDKS
jgi:hypothetical protein